MSISPKTHEVLEGILLGAEPSRLEKIAAHYLRLGTLGVDRAMRKAAARSVEVRDVIGKPSPGHPGHMSNVEADVINEMIRQRNAARHKRAEHQKTLAYVMDAEGGPEFLKAAAEQGVAMADYLLEHDPGEAERIKQAFNVGPALQSAGRAGMTAADLEKAVGSATTRTALGRAAVMAPAGYFAGRAMGKDQQQKDRYGNMGALAGLVAGPASAMVGASRASSEIGQLKLLERAMNAPAADVMEAGTSLQREQGIRRGATEVLKERAASKPKTATEMFDWTEKHVEPVIKVADDGDTRSYVVGIDPAAPGSLLTFLKTAGIASQLAGAAIKEVALEKEQENEKKKEG